MTERKMTVAILLLFMVLISSGCQLINFSGSRLPPILSQDEIVRPYEKLGRIQITREVYLVDLSLSNDLRAWGFNALRHEAAKMNADAVILPEVTGHTNTPVNLPSAFPVAEYRATGVAIKFK